MSFPYHRSLAPMMWVFFALVLIETAVVHLLVALWSAWVALALSTCSLVALIWLAALIRSFAREPVSITEGVLHWRCGRFRSLAVPLDQLGSMRAHWDGALIRESATFNAALIAWPNVVVELKTPMCLGRRRITRLAHKLDDRDAFVAALSGLWPRA